ncbi:MAG: hypothetical protein ACRDFB_10965, partial [Rhabdochlamydiaceae bacterium]
MAVFRQTTSPNKIRISAISCKPSTILQKNYYNAQLASSWADSSAWLERSTDKIIQISKGRGFESHS